MMELKVPSMSCGSCARGVTKAVQAIDPAAGVEVDMTTKIVSITTTADIRRVEAAIEEAGYKVERLAA